LGSRITSDARCICEVSTSKIAMAKGAFIKNAALVVSKLDLNLRNNLVNWSIALYGEEIWKIRVINQKQLTCVEMWCCRRMEMFSWSDRARTENLLRRLNEARNILQKIGRKKAN